MAYSKEVVDRFESVLINPDKHAFKYKNSYLFVNVTKKESISSEFSSSLILAIVVG